jgi:hypothetical protein
MADIVWVIDYEFGWATLDYLGNGTLNRVPNASRAHTYTSPATTVAPNKGLFVKGEPKFSRILFSQIMIIHMRRFYCFCSQEVAVRRPVINPEPPLQLKRLIPSRS